MLRPLRHWLGAWFTLRWTWFKMRWMIAWPWRYYRPAVWHNLRTCRTLWRWGIPRTAEQLARSRKYQAELDRAFRCR